MGWKYGLFQGLGGSVGSLLCCRICFSFCLGVYYDVVVYVGNIGGLLCQYFGCCFFFCCFGEVGQLYCVVECFDVDSYCVDGGVVGEFGFDFGGECGVVDVGVYGLLVVGYCVVVGGCQCGGEGGSQVEGQDMLLVYLSFFLVWLVVVVRIIWWRCCCWDSFLV